MMITAELAAFYRRLSAPRQLPDDEGTQPVFASATLRPGLPDAQPGPHDALPRKGLASADREAAELRAYRRPSERQGDSDGQSRHDRRQGNQAVLIDTRSTRGRRESDLNAMIDFEI